ncbi:MAG: hypothetical protein KF912_08010 [Phycisphaeraceae bacterium]|nr:hypothetical protein [Phycisphaeraceae bacterium]MBX3367246.1 hypothetical protein [Phycisphaeraceae bacterium]
MGATGLEPSRDSGGKAGGSLSGGNKSGNNRPDSSAPAHLPPTPVPAKPTDPELAAVVAAWPDLPPAIRAGVLALVNAGTPTKLNTPA